MSTLFSYFNRVDEKSSQNTSSKRLDEKSSQKISSKRLDEVASPCTKRKEKRGTNKRKKQRLIIESDESDGDADLMPKNGHVAGDGVVDTANREHADGPKIESVNTSRISTPKRTLLSEDLKTDSPDNTPMALTPSRKQLSSQESFSNQATFPHDKLKWLQKDYVKDNVGRRVVHPDYNRRTVQVPQDYYSKLTPGFQQWWIVKGENFDAVIMFKVGKFYELYHMDAVIGVQELGLVFMKSEFAHCGFPETGFGRYSSSLVQKGYKVVRVEQMETSAMMEQRIKKIGATNKADRVVRREVCSVITKGIRTLNFFDGNSSDHESVFLLAVKEVPACGGIQNKEFGVCFVDTCVGTFHLGQFKDDSECSRLRTLLAHYPPGHLLHERRGLLPHTNHLLDLLLPASIKDALVPDVEYLNASETLKTLAEGGYFDSEGSTGVISWPPILKAVLDPVGLSVATEFELAVSALGACVWCLKRAHVDYNILSLASFQKYEPLDAGQALDTAGFFTRRLILDDITLANLNIISPNKPAGSLIEKLDNTATAFGKRLLWQWVCAPLADIAAIKERQDAVEQLVKNCLFVTQAKEILCKLPDLERLLRKIHNQGCHAKTKDHPDSRAIFFEHAVYSRRKIADFISVLDGLRMSLKILDIFDQSHQSLESTLLHKLLTWKEGGKFPNLEEQITFFENSFDRTQAAEKGLIVPNKGVNSKYDSSHEEVKDILKELDQYLKEQRKRLGCKSVTYWGSGRNRFQLEVAVSLVDQKIEDYELTSQRKGFQRYRTPAINAMLKRLTAAEERRDKSLRNTMEDLFQSFDQQ